MEQMTTNIEIAIIGLGYVGFPLLCAFSKKHSCWGLDINVQRVREIQTHIVSKTDSNWNFAMPVWENIQVTSDWANISKCNFFVVTVPTPVDAQHRPDTSSLRAVCVSLGKILKRGDIIVFESTVYPSATEELCVPIVENLSGMKLNTDFFVAYSPERINVGDKEHSLCTVPKIVSASHKVALKVVSEIYQSILDVPVVKASCIKVAEAAKMYENVQRDVLIALANEYADFCRQEGISIDEVTRCSSTKWNFAKIMPGLVGGHCIGVDPYYLLYRSATKGVSLPIVRTAREINESVAAKVAHRIIDFASTLATNFKSMDVLILGLSYKRDTSDIRNTKVADIIRILNGCFREVDCYDPLIDINEAKKVYPKINLVKPKELLPQYDLVIRLVPHRVFQEVPVKARYFKDLKDFL